MSAAKLEQLVKMANEIALNCGERRDPEGASRRASEHLRKFWTPAMRAQLAEHAALGGDGLSPAVRLMLDSQPDQLEKPG